MFGYIQANLDGVTPEEKEKYQAAYCGLCHTLGKRHGLTSRLALSYDLTFLTLLFSSLYEPKEDTGESRCMIHPCKKRPFVINKWTEYAADMTVALTYFNCLDDWKDEHRVYQKCYASSLASKYKNVKEMYPRQCETIERELGILSDIENKKSENPDEAANSFGRLMASLFMPVNDNWTEYLGKIGYGLGKFIYIADAAVDYDKDLKKNNYNPLVSLEEKPEDMRPILKQLLGDVSEVFEMLPLVQDIGLLRNILYSGLWVKFNNEMKRQKKGV